MLPVPLPLAGPRLIVRAEVKVPVAWSVLGATVVPLITTLPPWPKLVSLMMPIVPPLIVVPPE